MICQHCKQRPAVLKDRHGILCAACWMEINTNCRPDVAPTSGLEHGETRRDFHNSLEEKDSLSKTPTTTESPAADARPWGSTGTAHE